MLTRTCRALWTLVLGLSLPFASVACGDAHGTCETTPVAYVFPDNAGAMPRSGLRDQLEAAGFRVRTLPLDRSPRELAGLIVFPSYVSSQPTYNAYMGVYAADLYAFIDAANVVLQLTQDDASEGEPPFLPSTHGAIRSDDSFAGVEIIAPDHPLLADVPVHDSEVTWTGALSRDTFLEQAGFEVLLAASDAQMRPVLLEGAYGQGRVILASMAFDRPLDGENPGGELFAGAFLSNLADHVSSVCTRSTEALTPDAGELPERPFAADSWTLAALPDTQVYSLRYPGIFDAQTSWIAREAEPLNIRYVAHLGDIVNNNSHEEWGRARSSMALLDDLVPYAIVPGNHDYGPSGDASTRDTLLNQYFDFAEASGRPGFGGAYLPGQLDNTYHLFSAGGEDWILLALEWGPRDEVIGWANEVMDAHADRLGILVTHAYLNNDDRRYDHTLKGSSQPFNPHEYSTPGGVNDGQELWQKLVRHHDFVLTFNGHVLGDGTGYLLSETDTGARCHQLLANYQMRDLGGEGYLRLLEFRTDGQVIVRSYSPLYDRFLGEPDQYFDFTL